MELRAPRHCISALVHSTYQMPSSIPHKIWVDHRLSLLSLLVINITNCLSFVSRKSYPIHYKSISNHIQHANPSPQFPKRKMLLFASFNLREENGFGILAPSCNVVNMYGFDLLQTRYGRGVFHSRAYFVPSFNNSFNANIDYRNCCPGCMNEAQSKRFRRLRGRDLERGSREVWYFGGVRCSCFVGEIGVL